MTLLELLLSLDAGGLVHLYADREQDRLALFFCCPRHGLVTWAVLSEPLREHRETLLGMCPPLRGLPAGPQGMVCEEVAK